MTVKGTVFMVREALFQLWPGGHISLTRYGSIWKQYLSCVSPPVPKNAGLSSLG